MEWISLNNPGQLDDILSESKKSPVLIYKHSTRCNVSRTTLDRLERNWNASLIGNVKGYFLDLISFREISDQISELFQVEHHSPQILVISDRKSILDLSHFDIDFERIRSAFKNLKTA